MNDPNITSPEVTRAGNLADKIEGNEKLKKRLVRLIFIILALIFTGFLAWGINSVLLTEGTELMPEDYAENKTPLPQTGAVAIALFENMIKEASDGNETKVSVKTSLEIDDESVIVSPDENGLIKKTMLFMKDEMLENLSGYHKDISAGFGEPFADALLPVGFNASELKTWNAEDDGENRTLYFDFPSASYEDISHDIKASVGMNDADDFISHVKQKLLPVYRISDIKLVRCEPSIAVTANRLNDRLSSVTYKRVYKTEAVILFGSELESLGERRTSFDFISTTCYDFTWAGITLSDSVVWLEKGKTEVLEAFRTADELLEVTWSSSDESVVSVDSEGYIKGHKTSKDPVTVTASFEYLGKTYTADCLVYVVVPVKDARLNERELYLKSGETANLSVEILPKKATVKEVRWFTTDEKVAVVDDSGRVTAIAEGVCKVYCITENMNYKRSCTITVEG